MNAIIKSRASSLNKIANLPKYRHPADLVNEFQKPMLEQNKMINGELEFGQNLYGNDSYEALVKQIVGTRKGYRTANLTEKKNIAKEQFSQWNSYFEIKLSQLPQEYRITDLQKNNIYEALIITKQRNEERLALSRFINFFNQYSKGFKFDIQLNPMVMMKLTYPHWGYFNLFPSVPAYRLQIQQLFQLLQELMVVGIQREQGNTLHSSELLSFIFWKIYTRKFNTPSTPLLSTADFCTMLSYFKFNQVTPQNFQKTFSYSIQKGQLENSGDLVRFDLWRQIFLDRNL